MDSGTTLFWYDYILTWLHLPRQYFQINSHSQIPDSSWIGGTQGQLSYLAEKGQHRLNTQETWYNPYGWSFTEI